MNRPIVIWNMFKEHFGEDYFLEVIEEEYGMTPGANEVLSIKISEHFDKYIQNYANQLKEIELYY